MKARTYLVAAGAMLLFSAGSAQAQSPLSGTLDVTLNLTSACTIAGDDASSGVSFGTLDFGSAPATFVGELATTAATGGAGGSGDTLIVCSPDVTTVDISIDGGANAGEGGTVGSGSRALAGPSSGFVPYEVYADTGHTSVYTIGTEVSYTIPTAGEPFTLPVYGLINKTSSDAVPSGDYTDQLTVTISFD